jgi:hypothetical protein
LRYWFEYFLYDPNYASIAVSATRRHVVRMGVGLLLGLAGCSDFSADESLKEVHLGLLNKTDGSKTFHFVLEANEGLGQWHAFALDPNAHHKVTVEPATDRQWSGYHAIAGDTQISGTLLGQGDERTCLQLDYRITDDEIIGTLPTSQSRC